MSTPSRRKSGSSRPRNRTYRKSGQLPRVITPSITTVRQAARLCLCEWESSPEAATARALTPSSAPWYARASRSTACEFVGFRDGWRGPLEADTMPLDVHAVRGILPRGGTILGSSRTNPFKIDGGVDTDPGQPRGLGVDALIAIGGEDTLGVAAQLHDAGHSRRRRAEDHRQRPRRHRLHVRLRHRGEHRHRGHRPAAHDGGVAPPGADRRGDGPPCRLDRAARRPRRRRERDPDP